MKRPFRIPGVQEVALGAPNKANLRRLWVDPLGLPVQGTYRSESETVDEGIAVAGSGAMRCEVDLRQPLDVSRKPTVHLPPPNHAGFWVDDLRGAVQWLSAQGVRAKSPPGAARLARTSHSDSAVEVAVFPSDSSIASP